MVFQKLQSMRELNSQERALTKLAGKKGQVPAMALFVIACCFEHGHQLYLLVF